MITDKTNITTTIIIPKNELQLLSDPDFLGSSFDMPKWMTQAIHDAIIRELDNLALTDLRKVRRLETKYGLDKPAKHYEGEKHTGKRDIQRDQALVAIKEIEKEREAQKKT